MDALNAPGSELTVDLLAGIAASGVRLIDLQFSDIGGGGKALTIPADLLAPTLARGYRFDGSALTGGLREVELDLYLRPDPRTLMVYPHTSGSERRARLCCSVQRRDGQPFAGDPRSLLERTLARAERAGFRYRIGVEMEFYLFPRNASDPSPQMDAAGYFGVGEEVIASTRDDVISMLQAMGIGVGGAHHETGPGQEELDLPETDALRMADQLITVRQAIRSIANRRGLRATFMPKPMADAPGSGMHVFQLLSYLDGRDALRTDDDDLSQIAYWAIGGQLAHANGMCAVVCPSVNSYKRLNAGHRAPRHATWARVSQASLIRVPSWADGEDAEIELRSPDALSNPYLVFATALACALDGIEQQIDPGEPFDENYTTYNDEELNRRGVTRLPGTLGEALTFYLDDAVVQETIGAYISSQLVKLKRDEWDAYRSHVSPWEFNKYVDA